MKKLFALVLSVCITVIALSVLPVHGEEEIYDSVLRLHVLANSDSDSDQALKLAVRDRIIIMTRELGAECKTLDEACAQIESELENICDAALKVINEWGYDYSVEVSLGKESYPRRTYDSLCFPAGEYLSLQVKIGAAKGQNWWCVLYPPLCLDAATESNEDAFISVGLTDEQYKVITESKSPTYRARLKILEVIEEAFTW